MSEREGERGAADGRSGIDELFAEVLGRLAGAEQPAPGDDQAQRLFARLARLGRPALDPEVSLAPPVEPGSAASRDGARLAPLRKLAEGGMGEIWAVWDADVRRTLAMKLARGDAGDGRALHRLLEEAQVTGQLEHPGVVPVHELGLDADGRVYFTMQLVEGRDLGRILPLVREGAEGWTLPRAVGVLARVCEALAYAHAKGVLHRDLKPANVMVGRFGEVYVMDWGLAKVRGREDSRDLRPDARLEPVRTDRADDPDTPLCTLDGSVVGTPAYMPPEQARGEVERIDERSDVYSLGAILYQMLAGRAPYAEARSPLAKLRAVVAGSPAILPSSAPVELAAICEKAMAREPGRRYASVDALRADLQAWLDGRVVAAHESGAFAELRKWVRRNRAVAALAAGLALALLVGTIVSTTQYVLARDRGRELERALGPVDLALLQQLEREADAAWPLAPERLPEWRDWLRRARELGARLSLHRERLARVGRAREADLARFVEQLERFLDPARGRVEGRSPEHGPGVARRVELLARQREALGGLRGVPELELPSGLLPLGPDPASGLAELADLRTGEDPARDAATGALVIDESSAVVFVLIPAGSFWLGAQSEDPGGPNHLDPALLVPSFAETGLVNESPPTQVTLTRPFLLSKYELTQAQWQRLTGVNPSGLGPDQGLDLRHPVEQVSWSECARLASWLGWRLPTEVQWEYAARAGTRTPWWTGARPESLLGAANLADRARARWLGGETLATLDSPELDDGFGAHAPVGSLRANPFGLHDVHGNVHEWCRDLYRAGYAGARWRPEDGERESSGDGARPLPSSAKAVLRGGSFNTKAFRLRSSYRAPQDRETAREDTIGFRPSMALELR